MKTPAEAFSFAHFLKPLGSLLGSGPSSSSSELLSPGFGAPPAAGGFGGGGTLPRDGPTGAECDREPSGS
jgi:hypothetical protein